ncbi:hypothetical protein F4803DRAFT_505691 [Xylaria telfairii]|nr:hypothetical protein F4803DRAFT_505691 [Xylaria telfairii]
MAISHHRKDPADKMNDEQAVHRHNDQTNTKTKQGTSLPSRVVTWPFHIIKQTWKDYQNGRNMQKLITQEQEPAAEDDQRREATNKNNKQRNHHETPVSATKGSPPGKYYDKPPPEGKSEERKAARPVAEYWVHQGGDYPWRIEQVVHRGPSENVRGLWVLEVKDLYAMHWGKKNRPHAQWPFPRQVTTENEGDESTGCAKERDELMDYLKRP